MKVGVTRVYEEGVREWNAERNAFMFRSARHHATKTRYGMVEGRFKKAFRAERPLGHPRGAKRPGPGMGRMIQIFCNKSPIGFRKRDRQVAFLFLSGRPDPGMGYLIQAWGT